MAQSLITVQEEGRCMWTADKPYQGCDRKSPFFTFQCSEWYFLLDVTGDSYLGYRYNLYIKNYTGLFQPFDITVYIVHYKPILFSKSTSSGIISHIWSRWMSELSSQMPEFEVSGTLKFGFIFHGDIGRTLSVRPKTDHKSVQTPPYLDAYSHFEAVSRDFAELLAGGSNHDVELACGDHTLKAHRVVLRSRSGVFAAMLQSDMLEGKTGQVKIRDMEVDIFQQFIRFLYTGNLPELTMDTAKRLYEVGDQYAVEGLKKQCSSFLAENLTQEIASEILALADLHSDEDFREKVIVYIMDQKVPLDCWKDDCWKDFCANHPLLAIDILNRFSKLHCSK